MSEDARPSHFFVSIGRDGNAIVGHTLDFGKPTIFEDIELEVQSEIKLSQRAKTNTNKTQLSRAYFLH